MKTILYIISFVLITAVFSIKTFAQSPIEVGTITNISGLTDTTPTKLSGFLENIYYLGIGIAVLLAVAMIVYGGFRYMTSEIPGIKTDGKGIILGAVFGLLLVLAPVLVFSIINPKILNLDTNLSVLQDQLPENVGGGDEDGDENNIVFGKWGGNIKYKYTQMKKEDGVFSLVKRAVISRKFSTQRIYNTKKDCKEAHKNKTIELITEDLSSYISSGGLPKSGTWLFKPKYEYVRADTNVTKEGIEIIGVNKIKCVKEITL